MTELPTTAIGLIAFIVIGAGYLLLRIVNQQTATFMTYIEKKNGNLEKATKLFTDTLQERDIQFTDAIIKQADRHKEAMDDLAARLESNLVDKNMKHGLRPK